MDQDSIQSPFVGICAMWRRQNTPRRPGEWLREERKEATGDSPPDINGDEGHSRVPPPLPEIAEIAHVSGPWGMATSLLSSSRSRKPRPPLLREMTNDHLPSLIISAQMRTVSPIREERAPGPVAVEYDH